MDISLFPKGRYVAKKTIVRYKFPYGSQSPSRPFGLLFSNKNNMCWDFEAFRPDPFLDSQFTHKATSKDGVPVIVLYEKCCKIPRYIFEPESKMWFVNTR